MPRKTNNSVGYLSTTASYISRLSTTNLSPNVYRSVDSRQKALQILRLKSHSSKSLRKVNTVYHDVYEESEPSEELNSSRFITRNFRNLQTRQRTADLIKAKYQNSNKNSNQLPLVQASNEKMEKNWRVLQNKIMKRNLPKSLVSIEKLSIKAKAKTAKKLAEIENILTFKKNEEIAINLPKNSRTSSASIDTLNSARLKFKSKKICQLNINRYLDYYRGPQKREELDQLIQKIILKRNTIPLVLLEQNQYKTKKSQHLNVKKMKQKRHDSRNTKVDKLSKQLKKKTELNKSETEPELQSLETNEVIHSNQSKNALPIREQEIWMTIIKGLMPRMETLNKLRDNTTSIAEYQDEKIKLALNLERYGLKQLKPKSPAITTKYKHLSIKQHAAADIMVDVLQRLSTFDAVSLERELAALKIQQWYKSVIQSKHSAIIRLDKQWQTEEKRIRLSFQLKKGHFYSIPAKLRKCEVMDIMERHRWHTRRKFREYFLALEKQRKDAALEKKLRKIRQVMGVEEDLEHLQEIFQPIKIPSFKFHINAEKLQRQIKAVEKRYVMEQMQKLLGT